jgi:hypothetical protein
MYGMSTSLQKARGDGGAEVDQGGLHALAQLNVEAEVSELSDGLSPGGVGVFPLVVVPTRSTVGPIFFEHAPDGGEDVVLQGHVRAPAADPRGKAAVPGPENGRSGGTAESNSGVRAGLISAYRLRKPGLGPAPAIKE